MVWVFSASTTLSSILFHIHWILLPYPPFQAPFCGDIPCEDKIKKDSAMNVVVEEGAPAMGAKSLCIPFEQPKLITPDMKCICPGCDKPPAFYTLFGRSY